jgi:hypothetical protein
MMSNIARANKLFEAFDLLDRAHELVTEAVGDTNNKHEYAWELLEDTLKEYYNNLLEMQITQ